MDGVPSLEELMECNSYVRERFLSCQNRLLVILWGSFQKAISELARLYRGMLCLRLSHCRSFFLGMLFDQLEFMFWFCIVVISFTIACTLLPTFCSHCIDPPRFFAKIPCVYSVLPHNIHIISLISKRCFLSLRFTLCLPIFLILDKLDNRCDNQCLIQALFRIESFYQCKYLAHE